MTKKQYYCICCGKPYKQVIQDCQGIMPDIILLTCEHFGCDAYMQTTSPNNAATQFTQAHKLTIKYDINSGKKL